MPKSISRLEMAKQYDKKAEEHVRMLLEWEEAAERAMSPADRERCGEKARLEREAAIKALNEANIAFGPEIVEAVQDSDPAL